MPGYLQNFPQVYKPRSQSSPQHSLLIACVFEGLAMSNNNWDAIVKVKKSWRGLRLGFPYRMWADHLSAK